MAQRRSRGAIPLQIASRISGASLASRAVRRLAACQGATNRSPASRVSRDGYLCQKASTRWEIDKQPPFQTARLLVDEPERSGVVAEVLAHRPSHRAKQFLHPQLGHNVIVYLQQQLQPIPLFFSLPPVKALRCPSPARTRAQPQRATPKNGASRPLRKQIAAPATLALTEFRIVSGR